MKEEPGKIKSERSKILKEFFSNSHQLVKKAIEKAKLSDGNNDDLIKIYSDTVEEINSFFNDFNFYPYSSKSNKSYELLFREIKLVTNQFKFTDELTEKDIANGLDVCVVAVDSISKVIDRLPVWLKKLFDIIIEILKISKIALPI